MTILYVILGLIALVFIVPALIGTGWSYEKSISINAPLDKVWENTSTLAGLNRWNPWMAKDPNIKLDASGEDGQPGASFSWDSQDKNVGAGRQTILKVTDRSELDTRIDFLRPFKGTGEAYLRLTKEGGATKAIWGIVSSTPYPMNIVKIFGVIEKNMDKDFGWGLNKLKSICEG
jgi:Polyketide cyclase / dehydrase and lipid transport